MKNLVILFLCLLAFVASAQYKPNSYDTQADAAVNALIAARVGTQVAGSNFLSGPQATNLVSNASTNFALLSKQTVPLFYATNVANIGGTYNSWPMSARDTNGDFVVIFASGNRHLVTNRSVYLVRSTNHGYSWSSPTLIYTNGAIDISPGFAFGISSSGRYIFAACQTPVSTGVMTNTIIQYSDNQGATWTPATSFQTFTGYENTNVPAGQIITLANNRLCMGYSGFSNTFAGSVAFALTSDDNAVTWQTNFMVTTFGSGFRESCFAYLGNSNVLCLARRDQAFANQPNIYYQLHSTNNGTSWVPDGPVTLGFNTGQRQPCSMYVYGSDSGMRVVMVTGNRENTFLEAREVSAWDAFNNLTNVWLYARPETLATICVGQGDGGYGSPVGDGQSGDCIIPYYWSSNVDLTAPGNAQIRFASRSSRLAVPQNPQVLLYDTSTTGVTNSTVETDMVNFTVPANTLFGAHAYDVNLTGFALNNTGGAVLTNRIRVYYGSTVIYDQSIDGTTIFATGSGIRPYRINCNLKARGSTTNQALDGFFHTGSSVVPTVGAGNINSTAFAGGVFGNRVALNAQTNNVFRVTFTLSTNNVAWWFERDFVSVTYY